MIPCLLAESGQERMPRFPVFGIKVQLLDPEIFYFRIIRFTLTGLFKTLNKALFPLQIKSGFPVRIDTVGPVFLRGVEVKNIDINVLAQTA